ncbi:MAG: hypothetical protein Q8R15_04135, partial [Candidatus Micrarchaeota archaeon]|nr:hypothetical protein [Candidatus Micrarchaeota archaeon]
RVIDAHPDALSRLNGVLFTANDSVRRFFLAKSYGKFDLGAEEFVVSQDFPTVPSVVQELGSKVNWSGVNGVIAVHVGDCGSNIDADGGGASPQEFETPNGNISLGYIYITACGLYPLGQENFPARTWYILAHELSHSILNMFGHANLVDSLPFYLQYNLTPSKLASVCSISFNSSDPEIRSLTPSRGCKVNEYGDPFDILGGGSSFNSSNQFSVYEKQRVGWIPETTTTTAMLTSLGNYDLYLYPHDLAPNEADYLVHVKIPKGPYGFYSVEYRAKLGEAFSPGDTRVLIRYGFHGGGTSLIAVLAPGEAYTNDADNFAINFNSVSQLNGIKTADINVNIN